MKIFAKTDVGLLRPSNEDAYVYLEKDEQNFMAFVCDGMGGHLGGSFAAHKTIEVLTEAYKKLDKVKNVGVWLYETLQNANSFVYEESLTNPSLKGMGTTVSGVIKIDGNLFYAHLGDSRIYLYDNESFEQITTDHTLVNTLLHNGLITYKQSLKHPKKHVLTTALGIKKDISVDIGPLNLKSNQNLLICSDRLHNMLDSKKMHKILTADLPLTERANDLLTKALQAGGTDNITFVIIENNSIAWYINTHISTAAKQINKPIYILREMGQYLRQKLVFSSRIIERRLDKLFLLVVIAFAEK